MEKIPTPPKGKFNFTNDTRKHVIHLSLPYDKEDDTTKTEIKAKAKQIMKGNKKVYRGVSFKQAEALKVPTAICSFCNRDIDKSILKYHMESHPTKVLDWLYLGSYNNATNKKELSYINVKYVLNCAFECKNLFPSEFKYKHIPASDVGDYEIIKHFDDACTFIEEARSGNSVIFVHCQMGKSRSASIVIAYLIKHHKYKMQDAFTFLKKQRKMILPNMGFMNQLKKYESTLTINNN